MALKWLIVPVVVYGAFVALVYVAQRLLQYFPEHRLWRLEWTPDREGPHRRREGDLCFRGRVLRCRAAGTLGRIARLCAPDCAGSRQPCRVSRAGGSLYLSRRRWRAGAALDEGPVSLGFVDWQSQGAGAGGSTARTTRSFPSVWGSDFTVWCGCRSASCALPAPGTAISVFTRLPRRNGLSPSKPHCDGDIIGYSPVWSRRALLTSQVRACGVRRVL
jgi:hypothetical protein